MLCKFCYEPWSRKCIKYFDYKFNIFGISSNFQYVLTCRNRSLGGDIAHVEDN